MSSPSRTSKAPAKPLPSYVSSLRGRSRSLAPVSPISEAPELTPPPSPTGSLATTIVAFPGRSRASSRSRSVDSTASRQTLVANIPNPILPGGRSIDFNAMPVLDLGEKKRRGSREERWILRRGKWELYEPETRHGSELEKKGYACVYVPIGPAGEMDAEVEQLQDAEVDLEKGVGGKKQKKEKRRWWKHCRQGAREFWKEHHGCVFTIMALVVLIVVFVVAI